MFFSQVQLLESKTYYSLGNLPKSRAALTSARTTANSIYISPKVQAQLDMQVCALDLKKDWNSLNTEKNRFIIIFYCSLGYFTPLRTKTLRHLSHISSSLLSSMIA